MIRPGLAHVREVLQLNRAIRAHLEHRNRELALLDILSSRLPAALQRHCRDGSLVDGVLTLYLDSPAWSTRARFAIEAVADTLRGEGVVRVTTLVRPASDTHVGQVGLDARSAARQGRNGEPPRVARLSDRTIEHLEATADAMGDGALAETFRRIAQRHRAKERGDFA
jgi:hypothetical protein